MAAQPNAINSNLWRIVSADDNSIPIKVLNTYIPLPTSSLVGGVIPDGTTIFINQQGVISSNTSGGGVGLSVPYIAFTSSAIGGQGQFFSNVNLAAYNNDPTRATVVVNGAVITPITSYTILGQTLTILDYLPPNSLIHVQATAVSGGGGGNVTSIIAGSNVVISPTTGIGNVIVSVPNIVTQLVAGSGIALNPAVGTGIVTITATTGGTNFLSGLLDVLIFAPTYVNTGLIIIGVNGNIITTNIIIQSAVVVGDYIRGDNTVPNSPFSIVTNVTGNTITVANITGLNAVVNNTIFKASSTNLNQKTLVFDLPTNKWIAGTTSGGGGVTNLRQLFDVAVTEPVYTSTTLMVASFTSTVITTTTPVGINVLVGDYIRGDNAVPNSPYAIVTAVSGSTITVASTAGFGFVNNGIIYKASSTNINGQALTYNLAVNKWVPQSVISSVGLTTPNEFTVMGSPVTGTGTLVVTKANQNPNTVWAGPASGVTANAPSFRALVISDIPTGLINYDSTTPTFTDSTFVLSSPIAAGATTFTSTAATFAANDTVSFRNIFTSQIYTITAVSGSTFTFVPALLAADASAIGATIYSATGVLSRNNLTDIVLGTNLTGVYANGQLTINASGGGSVGATTVQGLTDVAITEPTYVDTTLIISSFTGTIITTTAAVGVNVVVGDYIRGDNITANSPFALVTAVSGSTITVASTAGFGFANTGRIYKASSTTINGQVFTYDLATNKFVLRTPTTGAGGAVVKRYSRFTSRELATISGAPMTTTGLDGSWTRSPNLFPVASPYTHTTTQLVNSYTPGFGWDGTLALSGTTGGNFSGGTPEIYTDTVADNGHVTATYVAGSATFTVGGSSGGPSMQNRTWTDAATNPGVSTMIVSSDSPGVNNVIGVTTDGLNWRFSALPLVVNNGNSRINCVFWDGIQYIVGGEAGLLATSPDGVTWTRQTITGISGTIRNIAANATRTLYAINNGSFTNTTLAGAYTARTGAPTIRAANMTFVNGAWFSTSSNGTTFIISRTLDPSVNNNWTTVASVASNQVLTGKVVWDGTRFAVGTIASATSLNLLTSTDGITWTSNTTSVASGNFYGHGTTIVNNLACIIASYESDLFSNAQSLYTWNGVAVSSTNPTTVGNRSYRDNGGFGVISPAPAAYFGVTGYYLNNSGGSPGQTSFYGNMQAVYSAFNQSFLTITSNVPYRFNAVGATGTALSTFNIPFELTGQPLIDALVAAVNASAPTITQPTGIQGPAFTVTSLSSTTFQLAYAWIGSVTAPLLSFTQSEGGAVPSTLSITVSTVAGSTPSTVTFTNIAQASNRAQFQITGAPSILGNVYSYPVNPLAVVGFIEPNIIVNTQQTLFTAVTEFRAATTTLLPSGAFIQFRDINSSILVGGSSFASVRRIAIDTTAYGATIQAALQALTTNNYIFVSGTIAGLTTATVTLSSNVTANQIVLDLLNFFNSSELAYTASASNNVLTITGSINGNNTDITQTINPGGSTATIVASDFTLVKVQDGTSPTTSGTQTVITFNKAANFGAGDFSVTLPYISPATSTGVTSAINSALRNQGYLSYYDTAASAIRVIDADPTSGGVLTYTINNGSGPAGTFAMSTTVNSTGTAEVINASPTGWSAPINEGTQVP